MKFKATGISDACPSFCIRFPRWIFYGILIIPIYKKSAGAFLGLQPMGWLFNVMRTHGGGQSHFLQGISRST